MSKIEIDEESGCWVWTAGKIGSGLYPALKVDGSMKRAHRLSYEHFKGDIPEGYFVCHHCDNKQCVNPDHLFVGTNSDNMKDMYSKGKGNLNYGLDHPNAKLSDSDITLLRRLYDSGECSQTELAKRFGISQSYVCAIVNRAVRNERELCSSSCAH